LRPTDIVPICPIDPGPVPLLVMFGEGTVPRSVLLTLAIRLGLVSPIPRCPLPGSAGTPVNASKCRH